MPLYKLKTTEHINLKTTLFSGQTFSFVQTAENEFTGIFNHKLLRLYQNPETEFCQYDYDHEIQTELEYFFTLDINYKELFEDWQENFNYSGLRLLRLPLIDTIFSFICSANNNIKRITKMVQFLRSKGEFVASVNNFHFYDFPYLKNMINIKEELEKQKFGYRKEYITETAEKLIGKIEFLQKMDFESARKFLLKLKGVGPKVADCILLMGMNFLNVVPIDTHVFKTAKKMFSLDGKLSAKKYKMIQDKFEEKYGKFAGIAQLYLFKKSVDERLKLNF